mmetsp:Transcript_54341/g.116030  ORF Transcript_54341/g.116030 Transcript_54341/m.116030 type:complete len:133 (+) Transcript_54341:1998-2396(+)
MIGMEKFSECIQAVQAVLMERFKTDVKTTSNLNPFSFRVLPAKTASWSPAGDKSTSAQPVNMFATFHSLSPCRRKTTFKFPSAMAQSILTKAKRAQDAKNRNTKKEAQEERAQEEEATLEEATKTQQCSKTL